MYEAVHSFCESHPFYAIVIGLSIGFLLMGLGGAIGSSMGQFLVPILSRIFGSGGGSGKVTVNVDTDPAVARDHSGRPKLCIPEQCPDHKAERERSLRNEEEIKSLWDHQGKLRENQDKIRGEILGRLDRLEESNRAILVALLTSKGGELADIVGKARK